MTQGAKVGQVALYYGANDMGSTMLEENQKLGCRAKVYGDITITAAIKDII